MYPEIQSFERNPDAIATPASPARTTRVSTDKSNQYARHSQPGDLVEVRRGWERAIDKAFDLKKDWR